jgi:hypothetical protein
MLKNSDPTPEVQRGDGYLDKKNEKRGDVTRIFAARSLDPRKLETN